MFFCDGDFPGSERSVVMFLKDMTMCSVSLQQQSQKWEWAKVKDTHAEVVEFSAVPFPCCAFVFMSLGLEWGRRKWPLCNLS